jgi:hypothetical protein
VRTVLTVLLACLFVVMTTADRFACPDGCTDEAPAASSHTVSPCALCHDWTQAPVLVASRPAARVLTRQPIVIATATDPALPAFELPPKAA